jgi:hypothetical protein
MKPPVPTKRPTVILIKVKSCNTLLRMLLLCIGGYLKSVLRYKFVIPDTYHSDTLYLSEQGCEDPWLFSKPKGGPRAKKSGKHRSRHFAKQATAPAGKRTILPHQSNTDKFR